MPNRPGRDSEGADGRITDAISRSSWPLAAESLVYKTPLIPSFLRRYLANMLDREAIADLLNPNWLNHRSSSKSCQYPPFPLAAKSLETQAKKSHLVCRLFHADRYTQNSKSIPAGHKSVRRRERQASHPAEKLGSVWREPAVHKSLFVANLLTRLIAKRSLTCCICLKTSSIGRPKTVVS